jgi:predicted transcriptional regulator of viral defense system
MYGNLVQPPPDRRVSVLADRQHGVVTRRQLSELGLGKSAIDARIRAGWLHRIHQGVYAVGRPTLTTKGRLEREPAWVAKHIAEALSASRADR